MRVPMRQSLVLRYGAVALAALMLAGCGERSTLGLNGGDGDNAAWLVGRWRYTLLFEHEGQAMMSETTWRFESSGTAVRTVVTSNLTHGLHDTVERGGSWSLAGSVLTVTFPTTTTPESFPFIVTRESSTRILIGTIPFDRVSL